MMFLYDKLIGDLPPDFYTFKKQVHSYFPIIYDTKYISTLLTKKYKKCNIEKTDLDNVYKTLLKNKFDVYVDFFPDAINGFCLYNDMERDKLHDAGYDSIITGRSFILMNKALENGFETTNVIKQNMALGEKNLGEKKDEIVIKYGFTDKNIFNEYSNKTFLSLVESEKNGIINWNVGNEGQNEEEYIKGEKELISDTFKNVFLVKFKIPKDGRVINIYEISDLFENDDYDVSVVKSDNFGAFVEFIEDEINQNDDDCKKIMEIINEVKKNNDNKEWKIECILSAKEFYDDYKNLIKFEE